MSTSENEKIYQYRNCVLLHNGNLIKDDLWVRDGTILNPEKLFFGEKKAAHVQIDCKGAIICAGYIDIQINGTRKLFDLYKYVKRI